MTLAIVAVRGQRLGDPAEGFWVGPVFRNWSALLGTLAALLVGTELLAAAGYSGLATLLQALVLLGAALLALVDGWRRISGQPSFLGSGTRPGRLLAFVQMLIALSLLAAALFVAGS